MTSYKAFAKNEHQKRVVIYLRVSSKRQVEGASLETQEENCREYCRKRGWIIVEVVTEVHTGTVYRERKELSRIRDMVRNGEIDIVLVNSLDRLARDMIHQAVLLDEMSHHNVVLDSVTEDIDTSPLGNFMRQALGFAAAIEIEKKAERQERGFRGKVERGHMIGTGPAPYGYQWADTGKTKHTHYVLHPEESLIVRHIFDMYLSGMSMRQIALTLNEQGIPASKKGPWRSLAIHRILNRVCYTGKAEAYRVKTVMVNGKKRKAPNENPITLSEGIIPAIITTEEYQQVQSLMLINSRESPRRNKNPEMSLLRSGFIRCGYCGYLMAVQTHGTAGQGPNYKCPQYGAPGGSCRRVTIAVSRIDNVVWENVREVLKDLQYLEKALQALKNAVGQECDIEAIDRSIKKREAELEELSGNLIGLRGHARETLLKRMNVLGDDIEKLEAERACALSSATRLEQKKLEIDNFMQWAREMQLGEGKEATYEEKRNALRMLGVIVVVYMQNDHEHERYEIRYTLPSIAPQLADKYISTGKTKSL